MSKPPSELWYKCLVQYVLLFRDKKKQTKQNNKKKQKRVKVEAEEAGREGRDCKARTPQQLLDPPHLTTLSDFEIYYNLDFFYIVCTDE